MNKTFACLSAAVVITGFGAWVVAQQPKGATPIQPVSAQTMMQGTRVGVLNMNGVLKNYAKAQFLNNQIKNKVQGYATQMNQKKEEIAKIQAEMAKPGVVAAQREKLEKDILNIQRVLQDIDNEARRVISKEQGDIAVQIYREIEQVVKAVAESNNFDMVVSYPDATTPAEMYTQDNVIRKMANQAAIPVYFKPHIDLTDAVVRTLNASFPVPTQPPATTPAAPR